MIGARFLNQILIKDKNKATHDSLFYNEAGVVVIVVAVSLIALVASLAIVINLGLLYQEKRQLQTTADASALAGAIDLAEDRGQNEALNTARQYVIENANVEPTEIAIGFPEGNKVKVQLMSKRNMFFAGIINRKSASIRAESTAAFGAASGVANLVPFIVPHSKVRQLTGQSNVGAIVFGEDRPLENQGNNNNNEGQLGYFWLCDFEGDGGGIPELDSWIRYGYPKYVYAGQIANATGMKVSLKDALRWRMQNEPKIVVPIYDATSGGGSKGQYRVIGFAEFVITGFDLAGNPKTITGYFTTGRVVKGSPGQAPQAYFGIDTVWLVH